MKLLCRFLIGPIKALASRMWRSVELSVELSAPRIAAVGAFGVVGFPFYYFVWKYWLSQPYENLSLRLLGSAVCLPLMLTKWWPQRWLRYLPAYWYFVLIYCLPFHFTFMLLKNNGTSVFSMAYLAAVFFTILLIDWLNLIFVFIVGITLAWLAYYFTTDVISPLSIYRQHIALYSFALVGVISLDYTSERVKQEKSRAMLATASNIAHELRTPLIGIRGGASGLRKYLPALVQGYELAVGNGLLQPTIRPSQFKTLTEVLEKIESEVHYSNRVIDMLLLNARQSNKIRYEDLTDLSISSCIEVALNRYPFASEREKKLVTWVKSEDFIFRGSELLMVHVFFNLIKNALYYIAKAGKGEIAITLSNENKHNTLHFRDTATGIPKNILPHIFKPFFSGTAMTDGDVGTGVGLAFCKMVIGSFHGHITCDSEEGEYTEFTITLPKEGNVWE